MKTGKITSVGNGPERDVEVRITKTELFSAISDPPGAISGGDFAGYEIAEYRSADGYSFQLYVRLVSGLLVLFYSGVGQFDLALLLDEFEAAFPNIPRSP